MTAIAPMIVGVPAGETSPVPRKAPKFFLGYDTIGRQV